MTCLGCNFKRDATEMGCLGVMQYKNCTLAKAGTSTAVNYYFSAFEYWLDIKTHGVLVFQKWCVWNSNPGAF